MKKSLLFSVMALTTSFGASAQFNWIVNGDFEDTSKSIEFVTSSATPAAGDWALYHASNYEAFTGEKVTDDASHGTAYQVTGVSSVGWYRGYLMQTLKYAPKPEKYILSFEAKKVSGAASNVSAFIYVGGNNYALKTDFDSETQSKQSGARYDFTVTDAWQTFSCPYDFEQTCNSVNSVTSTSDWAATTRTADELASLAVKVCINSNAKNVVFLIDNIKLTPVNTNTLPDGVDPEEPEEPENPEVQPDPELPEYQAVPDEGDYLTAGNFESLEAGAIQNWRTKGNGKFLGDYGHWYFYNEETDGVDPYASTAVVTASGESQGNVMTLTNASKISSWWGHVLTQRVGAKLQPMTYRLSFKLRSNNSGKVKYCIALKTKKGTSPSGYAMIDGFVPADHPLSSGTTPDVTGTSTWTTVETVYNLSQMATTIWSPTSGYTTDSAKQVGIANYIKDITNSQLWENAYVMIWNEKAGSTIEIDDVVLEPVDNFSTIQNPSFETSTLLPVILSDDPSVGQRSGQWAVVNKRGGEINLSIDNTTAADGQRSLKLETVTAAKYPRLDQYMALDLYEVPEGKYNFTFNAKASAADAPIRVDVFVYYDEKGYQAITGDAGNTYEDDSNVGHGLTVYKATTDWAEYSHPVVIPENYVIRLIIRPNIQGTNNTAMPSDYTLPVTHWFDNFRLETVSTGLEGTLAASANVWGVEGAIRVASAQKAAIDVYSANGVLVASLNAADATIAAAPGLYIVKLTTAEGVTTAKVLVK